MEFDIWEAPGYIRVKPANKVIMDERIDKVLDSCKFDFYSSDFTTNIPPLTIMRITKDTKTTFMLCSTTCNRVVTRSNLYYHNLEAVELTYALQTWLLGTKAFSVYEDATSGDRNTNLTHITQMLQLLEQKYGIKCGTGVVNFPKFEQSREFTFGKGTTFYDALYEVMLSQGCIPRLTYVDTLYNNFILNCDNIFALETDDITRIDDVSIDQTTQDVDTYCDRVEVEMDNVIDRDTNSTWIGTVRSNDTLIKLDNSKLIIPNGFETVDKLYMKMRGRRYSINSRLLLFYRGNSDVDESYKSTEYSRDARPDRYILDFLGPDSYPETLQSQQQLESAIRNYLGFTGNQARLYVWTLHNSEGNRVDLIYVDTGESSPTIDGSGIDITSEFVDVSYNLLNKDQYELLEERLKPAYAYYDNSTGVIDGFNKITNNDLWGNIFGYRKGPFAEEVFYDLRSGVDIADKCTSGIIPINNVNFFYPMFYSYDDVGNPTDFTKYQYKVVYNTKTSFSNVTRKEYGNYKFCARSYNNGANSVDFNQLVIDMQREVNQLGLPCRTIESRTDVPLGTRTQYGYVVSKQTTYTASNEQMLFTYNCYPNVNQIALAIGVDTQYEATNIPQTGIVDRHVFAEIYDRPFKNRLNDANNVMLVIEYEDQKAVLFTSKLQYGDNMYFIAKTENNYSLGSQKLATSNDYIFINNEVRFGDKNCYCRKVKLQLIVNNEFTDEELNAYPLVELQAAVRSTAIERTIHKDPRERIIFTIKLN